MKSIILASVGLQDGLVIVGARMLASFWSSWFNDLLPMMVMEAVLSVEID